MKKSIENKTDYMAEYGRLYRRFRRYDVSNFMLVGSEHLKINPTEMNFKGSDINEPVVCAHFGCPTHLSLQEQRFGKFCIRHQQKKIAENVETKSAVNETSKTNT